MNDHDQARVDGFMDENPIDVLQEEHAGVQFDPLVVPQERHPEPSNFDPEDTPVVPVVRFMTTGRLETDNSPQARMELALEEMSAIVASLACPYYADRGDRKCVSGCYAEPQCMEAGDPQGMVPSIVHMIKAMEEVVPNIGRRLFAALADVIAREDDGIAEQASNRPEEAF